MSVLMFKKKRANSLIIRLSSYIFELQPIRSGDLMMCFLQTIPLIVPWIFKESGRRTVNRISCDSPSNRTDPCGNQTNGGFLQKHLNRDSIPRKLLIMK